VLDAVNLERMGVPTATVVTAPFEAAARAVAAAQGLPDLPLVVIPHDYLTEDEEAVRDRLAPVVDDVLRALFGPAAT
jgi:hypothetical protein